MWFFMNWLHACGFSVMVHDLYNSFGVCFQTCIRCMTYQQHRDTLFTLALENETDITVALRQYIWNVRWHKDLDTPAVMHPHPSCYQHSTNPVCISTLLTQSRILSGTDYTTTNWCDYCCCVDVIEPSAWTRVLQVLLLDVLRLSAGARACARALRE